MELDDGLDGLLELADAMCDDPGNLNAAADAAANPEAAAAAAAQQRTTAAPQQEEGADLLLCLADSFAETDRAAKDQHPAVEQQQQQQQQQQEEAAAGAHQGPAGLLLRPGAGRGGNGSSSLLGGSGNNSSLHYGSIAGHGSGGAGGAAAQQQQVKQKQPVCQHYVEKLTGLKVGPHLLVGNTAAVEIKLPRVSGIVLRERYRQMTYVPVSKARDHAAPADAAWVVVGVLVHKSIGSTSQGAPYSRWKLSDLAGSDAWLALFGDAHKDHYAEAEGSVLAFYSPRFASKGPGGGSTAAAGSSSSSGWLAVSQPSQVERLASSAGWGFCRGTTKTGARCSNAVDTIVSQFCQYHALQQAKTLKKAPTLGSRGGGGSSVSGALLGARGQAAAAMSGGAGQSTAAPRRNGKVYDARSNTWSTTSTQQQQQQQQPSHQSSSRPNSTSTSAPPPSGVTSSSLPISASGSAGRRLSLDLDANAAAACRQVAASCAAEARRRQEAEQAELREALRRKLLKQQVAGKGTQQQQQQVSPPSSETAAAAAAAAAGTFAGALHSRQQASRTVARPAGGGGGFKLSAVVAAVEVDKQRQLEEQQQGQLWLHPAPKQQQQQGHLMLSHQSRMQVATSGMSCLKTMALLRVLLKTSKMAAAHQNRPAAAAAAAGAAGDSRRMPGIVTGSGSTAGTSGSGAVASVVNASSRAKQHMRSDLGLGPKPMKHSGSRTGAAAGSKPGSSQQHVSRTGSAGACGRQLQQRQQQQKAPLAGIRTATAAGCAKAAGGAAAGFRATFGKVLQRTDINKPDARLLSSAADAAHDRLLGKLLDQYEQKDQLAQQLEGITKLQVTAFECRTCNALTEKRRGSCSGHDVVAVRVTKRWWICEACGWRVTTLREVMPSKRCSKCRDPGVLFRPTSACAGSKPQLVNPEAAVNPMASRDGMMARGAEHAFCLQNSI
ncbi:hypothetical protein COO60DRAFT_1638031 [Scenedesmus sp. NREL 46B-D3]|nr:hypothetical protein COO60DRAFT_1638031 [Scenedesmus sp. NREL 46B-D3]